MNSSKNPFGRCLCVLLTHEWFGTGSVVTKPGHSSSDRLSMHCHDIARYGCGPSKYPTSSI
jgi:hypothetical protein